MRVLLALVPLLVIAACMPEGESRLHEVVIYGPDDLRLTYFYGSPTVLMLGDREVRLERPSGAGENGPLTVEEALTIDGRRFLRERVPALDDVPSEVRSVERSSDLRVRVERDTGPLLYYDGNMWFTLLGDGRAGVDTRVVPRPRLGGLRGIGGLTRSEADALRRSIEEAGPAAVTVLDEIPAAPRRVDGVDEYRRTGLYVQRGFASVAAESARADGSEVVWEVLAEGRQASGYDEQQFFLITDEDDLRRVWNRAHGAQLQVPPLPEVDFSRETIVGLFLGTRPTGGYGLEVEEVTRSGRELFVEVQVIEPAEGAITTQALTSPWVLVRVLRGGIDNAWVRRAGSERLLGAARPLDR